MSSERRAPRRYAIRVEGHLDERWAAWFGDLTLSRDGDATTTLCADVADQSQLHGLLARVRDLGATLLSVTPLHNPEEGATRR